MGVMMGVDELEQTERFVAAAQQAGEDAALARQAASRIVGEYGTTGLQAAAAGLTRARLRGQALDRPCAYARACARRHHEEGAPAARAAAPRQTSTYEPGPPADPAAMVAGARRVLRILDGGPERDAALAECRRLAGAGE